MPPTSRKRKADAEGSSSAQSSTTGSKPKKKESAKTVERIRSRFRSRHTMDYPGTEEQFDRAWKEFMETKGDKSAAEFPGVPGFGSDGAARPATKRRKVSNSTPTTTAAAAFTSRSPKKPTPSSNNNNTAAASAPASVARSTKKVSKAQLQAQARERARLAMQNDSSAQVASPTAAAASAKKATPTKTTTKPKTATPPRKVAAAASPGESARKQPASRTTTASPGRRTTGTYRKSRTPPSTLFSTEAAAAAAEDDNKNVLPKPPSRFPTAKTTTTPKAAAADVGLGSFTQFPPTYRVDAAATPAPAPALPRMRAKTPPQPQQQQHQQEEEQEPVIVEEDDDDDLDDDDYVPDDIDSDDDDDEEEGLGLHERWQNLQPLLRKVFLTLGLPLLAALVIFFGIGRYNPSTGMWMIVGPTRQHYSCASQIVLWGKPCRSPDPANPYIVTDENPIDLGKLQQHRMPCYQDSPPHVLATLDESKRAQVDDINHYYHYYCDPNDDQDHDEWQSCPSNAICYKGRLLDCLAPAWVVYEREPDTTTTTTKKTPPVCVLSQAVNDTYTNLVNLIETWSIHHLCLVRTEGPAPRSFYTQQQVSNVDNDSALVKAEDDTSQAAATDGIPMYEWTTLYRMIDEGVEEHMQGEWDWKLLETANEAHKKQLVLSDGDATTAADGSITSNNMLSVGLATHRYSLAQRSKLPMSCKVSRGLMHTLELMGRLAWAILKGLFSMTWYCFKNYPKTTSITTLVVSIVLYIRHYRAKQRRHRKRVNDVRQKVLRHLQAAWSKQPGFGMQKGEVSVIQVRDEIVEKMFGYDEYRKRNDFQHNVWPVVVQQLGHDNRVKKGTRVIDGKRRSLWMWTASTAGESATQS